MGTDVRFDLEPQPARPDVAEPAVEDQAAPAGYAPVVGRVENAGQELLRSLSDAEADVPSAPAGPTVLIGRADDPAEAEADRIAKQVVQSLRQEGPPAAAPTAESDGHVHRKSARDSDPLGGTEVGGGVGALLQQGGGGQALPESVAAPMGESFGHDFSGVRIHTDRAADDAAKAVQAVAFTQGSDIYFSSGAYDPGSGAGQELLAHELTHVVQQGAGVHRKMWTVPAFEEATYESWHTAQSTAQKEIMKMLAAYAATYEAHGVVSSEDAPKAIAKIDEMRASAQWWISDHQVVDRKTKELKDDPNREKRMAGFRKFAAFLDEEKRSLQASAGKASQSGPPLEVGAPSPGFLKLQQKYEGNAKSFFEKIGDVAQKAVSENGDASELEAQVKFPVDPSGVGFIGGKFTAAIEKDDELIKMKASLSITGGADVEVAEVAGELGGYLEAQADSGADCMNLVSYAMYRRFRESHALPNEAASFLWGGQTGSYGFDKAEAWSLALEKKMFDIPTPVLSDFIDDYPTLAEAKAAHAKAVEEAEERRAAIYVETGGLAGATVEGGLGGVAKGSAGVQATEGRRVDFTSLQNRKGGAGKDNLGSDSVLAGVARNLTGGKRGAQKRTGRSTRSLMVTAGVEGDAGVVSLAGSATLQLKWSNDGVSKNTKLNPTGAASKTTMDSATLELAAAAGIDLGDLAGDAAGKWVEYLQGKIEDFVTEKAKPAAEKQKQADPEAGDEADDGLSELIELNEMALGVDDLKENLQDQLLEMAGGESESADKYKLVMTFDMVKKAVSFELRKVGETKIELPKSISIKKGSSSRMCRFTYAGGAWKRG